MHNYILSIQVSNKLVITVYGEKRDFFTLYLQLLLREISACS